MLSKTSDVNCAVATTFFFPKKYPNQDLLFFHKNRIVWGVSRTIESRRRHHHEYHVASNLTDITAIEYRHIFVVVVEVVGGTRRHAALVQHDQFE